MDTKFVVNLPREHRITFIALLAAICALSALFDFFVVPTFPESIQPTASAYALELSAALLVSIIIFWIVTSFLPRPLSQQGIHQLKSDKISLELDELLVGSLRWRYTGNSGRYLRGKVLPALMGRSNVQIVVSIIDPKNKPLCVKHADYRNSVNSGDKGEYYNADKVALEVIVTIIYCAWYAANKDMSIELFLLAMFDPLRIDANDEAMIMTIQDRSRPAVKLAKGHVMYDYFDLKMRYEREQGQRLDLTGFPKRPTVSAIEEEDIRNFLSAMDMQELCERLSAGKIVSACREVRNPYEN